jgi:hypothetical protein
MDTEENVNTLKESAIDWLINEMKKRNFFKDFKSCKECKCKINTLTNSKYFIDWNFLINEAKEIEKKYIKDSYSFGLNEGIDKGKNNEDPEFYSDEDYYNNNFNLNQ